MEKNATLGSCAGRWVREQLEGLQVARGETLYQRSLLGEGSGKAKEIKVGVSVKMHIPVSALDGHKCASSKQPSEVGISIPITINYGN